MGKILIIEDEKNLARFVELELKHEGFETEVRFDGRSGVEAALDENEEWDIILLDLYELLVELMENINVVLSRETLLNTVWGYEPGIETNVVDVYIRYLRNKIDVPSQESYIQTVRGTGYVMRK